MTMETQNMIFRVSKTRTHIRMGRSSREIFCYPEHSRSNLLRNIGKNISYYTASYPARLQSKISSGYKIYLLLL